MRHFQGCVSLPIAFRVNSSATLIMIQRITQQIRIPWSRAVFQGCDSVRNLVYLHRDTC